MTNSSTDFFKNENDRNDFYISIPVIAIAAVFILWQWGKSDTSEVNNPVKNEIVSKVVQTSSSEKVVLSQIIRPDEIEESSDLNRPKKNNHPVSSFVSNPEVSLIPTLIPEVVQEDFIESQSITTDVEAPVNKVFTPEEEDPKITSKEEDASASPVQEESENSEIESSTEVALDCSIAVGLYKKEINLNRMFDQLIENGYAAIKEPLRNSTKVGIKIPCDKASSLRILREIRADFASDAFIE